MRSFLTRAIDAQVRVELVRDLFKLEGLEPVPEDVALALEDDDVAREEIISFVVARFSIFIGVVVYVVYVVYVQVGEDDFHLLFGRGDDWRIARRRSVAAQKG